MKSFHPAYRMRAHESKPPRLGTSPLRTNPFSNLLNFFKKEEKESETTPPQKDLKPINYLEKDSGKQFEISNFEELSPEVVEFIHATTLLPIQNIKMLYYLFVDELTGLSDTGRIMPSAFMERFKTFGNEKALKKIIGTIDRNNDGIDFIEFISLLGTVYRNDIENKKKFLFAIYDSDLTGFVQKDEVKSLIENLSQEVKQYAIDRIQRKPKVHHREAAILTADTRHKEEEKEEKLGLLDRIKDKLNPEETARLHEKDEMEKERQKIIGSRDLEEFLSPYEKERVLLPASEQNSILFQAVENFFKNDKKLSFIDYQARESAGEMFKGFGILEFFQFNLFAPLLRKIDADILSPPTREGFLLSRKNSSILKNDLLENYEQSYIILENGFLYFYSNKPDTRERKKPKATITLLDCAVCLTKTTQLEQFYAFRLQAKNTYDVRYFQSSDERGRLDWVYSITAHASILPNNRYTSFAPPVENVSARWFADGRDAYSFMADAILTAKTEIFITDWWLCPSIYMKRDENSGLEYRLDMLLKKKADEGVQIYVIVWNETKIAMSLDSAYTQSVLHSLSHNVYVLRHPLSVPVNWTHHQKILIIDQDIAFVGGLDLCFGRWDTRDHVLTDSNQLKQNWPGKDYANEDEVTYTQVDKPFWDLIDRTMLPRMGWHDIHSVVDGQAARYVARTFIQRWNQHLVDLTSPFNTLFPKIEKASLFLSEEGITIMDSESLSTSADTSKIPLPEKPNNVSVVPISESLNFVGLAIDPNSKLSTKPAKEISVTPMKQSFTPKCEVQVIRSICQWSGSPILETSIHEAYIDLIQNAQRFIYIENQYFISSLAGGGVKNRVAETLLNRVRKAINEKTVFKVIVVMPSVPTGGSWKNSASIQYVMDWEYQTINRGKNSIFKTLEREFPKVDINQYIFFSSLRNYGYIMENPVSDQLYVHAKLMIVDDSVCIIGSANINDRSLAGDRDSEICVCIKDSQQVDSFMNGARFPVRKFAHELRKHLFREHLGLKEDDDSIQDPICDQTWNRWINTAKANSQIFDEVFKDIPSNNIKSFKQAKANEVLIREKPLLGKVPALEKIQGHLIEFPLSFLEEESLVPNLSEAEGWLKPDIFQ